MAGPLSLVVAYYRDWYKASLDIEGRSLDEIDVDIFSLKTNYKPCAASIKDPLNQRWENEAR